MRAGQIASLTVVLALVYLAVSAPPVAALQTNTVVGSQHTNASDFNGAATLDNVSVEDSGNAAFVKLNPSVFSDGFENEPADQGVPDNWEQSQGIFEVKNVSTNQANTGSQSAFIQIDGGGGQNLRPTEQPYASPITDNVSVAFYHVTGRDQTLWISEGSTVNIRVAMREGDLKYFDGGSWQTISTDPDRNEWVDFTVYDIDPATDTFSVEWEAGADSGQTTGISMASAMTTGYNGTEIRVNDGSGTSAGYFDDFRIGGSAENGDVGTYISQTHSVDNAVTGKTNLTNLNNVTAHVTWLADTNGDGTFETTAASSTYTTDGNKSLDISGTESTDWRVNVTFEATGPGATGELHDETVLFTNHQPEIDNSSATPTGDLSTATPTLEIQVNDTEFPLAQGDSVVATAHVDGTVVGTDTLTSNGTASVSVTNELMGGDHTVNWTVEDSYGLQNHSATFTISTPGNLSIRKELAPDEFVTGTTLNATIYYGDEVETRTVTNGNLSLTSFPTGQELTVRINASGYYTRTAVIEDIFEQQSMYLLNDTEPAYLVRFDLSDPTGNFPREDTVLFIERDLNQSDTTDWRIIAGDNFGVQGVPVDLDQNERYRLRIKNLETGDTNTIGGFTAIQAETVTISAGSATIEIKNSSRAYNWEARENETSQTVTVEYNDSADQTEEIKITIHERFNNSNVLVDNATYTNTNDLVHQESLTNQQVNETWMVELYVDRGDGFVHYRVPVTGGPRNIIPGNLDEVWVTAVGVFLVLITGMAFSQLNQGVGAVVTSLVGGILWYLGILSGVTIGPAVVAALGISLVFHYRTGGG